MRLQRLAISGWRNLAPAEVRLSPGLVVLWGENGAGKTNLLEAAAVLCTLRSFRSNAWNEVVSWERMEASVAGSVEGPSEELRVRVEAGRRTGPTALARSAAMRHVLLGGREIHDLERWFRILRAVVFTPDDTGMVRGGPERRRQFLDRAAFNAHPSHLDHVRAWRRAQAQKSALLRTGTPDRRLLETWNEALVRTGVPVARGRARAARDLAAPLSSVHEDLAQGTPATVHYRCALGNGPDLEGSYHRLLEEVREEEIRRGIPLAGIQRDDLDIRIGVSGSMRSARTWGSQGQVRTLALALRLAELAVAGIGGDPPLLLLDDLSSEVDDGRLARLVALLDRLSGQVIVTTTDPGPLIRHARGSVQDLKVQAGTVDPDGATG
ncbi:MAG: DNA replication and repair protein RecF [Deltaproteobacteria bacterium]|nr:DNA replication and repair protein RecF [Deltaproteobacteria bacterium]